MAWIVRGLVAVWVLSALAHPSWGQQTPPQVPAPQGEDAEPTRTAEGTVAGTVVDDATGDPILEAGVEVVGTGKRTRTDLDGRYSIKVPPGTYEVRIFAPLYQGLRLQQVLVRPNVVSTVDAALKSTGQAGIEVVEVVALASKATEERQLVERRTSAVVKDIISAETIKKSVGSDAADIVRRAPAVTISDQGFVLVRGLDERYTIATLNQSDLPSTNPYRRTIPLDVFPAGFLQSISVTKSYLPNLPGDFGGALINLDLQDYPEELAYSFGLSVGANTQATGQDFLTYRGAPGDYVTLGTRFRRAPRAARMGDFGDLSPAQQFAVGRSFKDIWSLQERQAPPAWGANFTAGNRWGPLGIQFGGIYKNSFVNWKNGFEGEVASPGLGMEAPEVLPYTETFFDQTSTFDTQIGGLLSLTYEFSDENKLTLRTLVNRLGEDQGKRSQGTVDNIPNSLVFRERLRYIARQLALGQLAGEHRPFPWLQIDWRTAGSVTRQDEPDTRFTTYISNAGAPPFFSSDLDGGLRYGNDTREWLSDSAMDVAIPFTTPKLTFTDAWTGLPGKLQVGVSYSFRKRTFSQQRFNFIPDSNILDTTLPPDELFAPDHISRVGGVNFSQESVPGDDFTATEEVIAGYWLMEVPILKTLRIAGGLRGEYGLVRVNTDRFSDITGDFKCPNNETSCPFTLRALDIDLLPGVNVIYSPRDDMNFRFGYSNNVNRPEFRERVNSLLPLDPDNPLDVASVGNLDLINGSIRSFDVRWEWFFGPLELVSVGGFLKKLKNPVEETLVPAAGELQQTYINAEDGQLYGWEFEFRKNFGFIHERLRTLRLETNVTWTNSTVSVPPQRINGLLTVTTNTERQLQGQAPFVINAGVEYTLPDWFTLRVFYYTAARSIFAVGTNGLPDFFFERRDSVDAAVLLPLQRYTGLPLSARITAENVINTPEVYTVANTLLRKYAEGVDFGLSISYSF